ncbi:MAG: hypothetical protein LQ346_008263 [Caloplaca aetnensis]|nr:MAG: hypothetical protein LQ346_008263 [Caloplaca aetnensis]
MPSFDGAQSIGSTPTPTPPTSRGQHQISSFNTATYPPQNGVPIQSAPPKRYHESNGVIPQQQYPSSERPQIYTAIYSGVSVYEMEVNRVAVMRRRSDSWLNATQILKVAGIEKGKRTKVLEKEILSGKHEKVQGGYGKYQGTWIDYQRGVAFCRQYGVADLLSPLLEYDMGQDGITAAGHGHVNTPTKEQAMAAQRKRTMAEGISNSRPSPHSQSGTFFQNISKQAAHAVNAIKKARFEPNGSSQHPSMQGRPPSRQMYGSQESAFQPSSQHSTQSLQSNYSFSANTHLDPALRGQNQSFLEMNCHDDSSEPPRKRARPSSSHDQSNHEFDNDTTMMDLIPTNVNGSFLHPDSRAQLSPSVTGLPPLPTPVTVSAQQKQALLLTLFQDEQNQTDYSNHPAITRLSGEDLDIPIDKSAHTAMHWAATLGRIQIVRALVAKGASPYRLNGGGETALMRAAITTNNFDNQTFPEALKLLGTSLEIRDGRGQTVLHHIAASSAIQGRGQATRYYLDSILLYIVGNSAPNSQQNSFVAEQDANAAKPRPVNLRDFMSFVVNARDMAGDTALHCAAKIGNKAIVQQLLEVGAEQTIANRLGLRPCDIPGVSGDPTDVQPSSQVTGDDDRASKVEEAKRELRDSTNTAFDEMDKAYQAERQKKQLLIDQVLTQLRDNVSQLAEERKRLHELERKLTQRKKLKMNVTNLQRASHALRNSLGNRPDLQTNIQVGEADAGLEVDAKFLPPREPYPTPLDSNSPESQYLDTLPPTEVLQARAAAYRVNNGRLEAQVDHLHSQSSELEAQLKKVVSLCTKVDLRSVDDLLPRLLAAVESENPEELEASRLSELLRQVDREAEVGED